MTFDERDHPTAADLIARSNRLGADPRNTNYAGGNTSAKGTETDPVTGQPVELLWVKGSGGDLGTLTEQGPGGAAAGPAARPGRRLPRGRPGGRDGRRVRLLPARQGRRRPVHRHRDARPGRRRARGSPAPGLRDRAGHRGRRGGADPQGASATGWRGCRGGAPASSSGWTSPRSRRRTRRPSAASSAGTASPPGATPARRPRPNSLEIIRTAEQFLADNGTAEPFGPVVPGLRGAAGGGAAREGRRAGPDDPRASPPRTGRRSGTSPTPTWCWNSWPAQKLTRAGRAGHVLPGPLPADQGQAAGRRPARARRPSRRSWPGWWSCTRPTAPTTRATTTATPPPTAPRSGARTRRSCWSRAWACSPSARTSRPPGSPASSTSTRST